MSIEIVCPQCGYSREISEEKIPQGVKWAKCPRCENRFRVDLTGQAGVPEVMPVTEGRDREEENSARNRSAPPWERRSEMGFWRALYLTSKAAMFSPRDLFATMRFEAGLKEPLAFGLLTGAIGTMAGFFWQFLVVFGRFQSATQFGHFGMAISFTAFLLFSIPYVVLALILASLILHGCLFLVRGARNGFEATFRVIAYSQATQVLSFIPFLGGLAALVWLSVVQMIGLKEIHEISYGRIVIAYLIPVLLFLVLVALALTFLIISFLRS